MILSQTSFNLPLTEAQKQEIHRAARRAQAEAFGNVFRAIAAGIRGLFAHKPATGVGAHHAKA